MKRDYRRRQVRQVVKSDDVVGREFEVEVERILPGGMGLAHLANVGVAKTVLVALAAPGDRVRVRVEALRGATAFASIIEVIEPSPVRIEPPCPYFGRCGGCDFQQLSDEAQLAAKVSIIRDCLRRIAHLEFPAEIPITPSPATYHYRSRARWQYVQRTNQPPLFGYYERGSLKVCDVVECPVVIPALQKTLTNLRARLQARSLVEEAGEIQAVAADDDAVSLAPSLDEDEPEHESIRTIGGERYRFNANCFFQINHDLLEPLIREAIKEARGEVALDLYCGVGLFTLPLARRFAHVIGVEGNEVACAYARRNLVEADLTNAEVETASVGEWMMRSTKRLMNPERFAKIDFVLLDPPRAGAEREAVEGLIELQPQRIAYVSCDPATLARDLKILTASNFRLDSLAAFDMFPQTHHVETVAHLSRTPS